MKIMIKTELERAFKSWGFWIALIIGIGISVSQIVTRIIPAAINPISFFEPDNATVMPASAFQMWLGNGVTFEYTLYVRLIPILAAMPYAVTYLSDIKSGIIKNYISRTAKINYLVAKYMAVFITGGIVIILPLFLNYLTAIAVLPSFVWPTGVFSVFASGMWSGLFYTNPHIYVIVYMILLFICGGLMSTVVLIVSNLVNNRFVAVLAPYIIAEFANAELRMADTDWIRKLSPAVLFNMSNINNILSYIVYIIFLLILGGLVYFLGGLKHEIY